MAKSFAYEVVERSSSTTGVGPYQLGGAPNAYRRFRDEFADGETEICYMVRNADNSKWEKNRFGTLTVGTPDQLSRNVIKSTNGDSPVSWGAADWPLTIYIPFDQEAQEGFIRGWLATTRSTLLKFGHWFKKDNPSVGKNAWNIFDGSSDIRIGVVNPTDHTVAMDCMPAGVVLPYAGATAPTGFLLCYGQAISRTTYAVLFAAIGTTYGAGDGSTTFNLPDLRGRAAFGKGDMGGVEAGRLNSVIGSALGAMGGAQLEAAGVSVSVSGGISGFTGGSLGVHVDGYTTSGADNRTNATGGGSDVAAGSHGHSVSADGATSGSLVVGGSFSGSGSGATAAVTNVPPAIVLNQIISTGGVA